MKRVNLMSTFKGFILIKIVVMKLIVFIFIVCIFYFSTFVSRIVGVFKSLRMERNGVGARPTHCATPETSHE